MGGVVIAKKVPIPWPHKVVGNLVKEHKLEQHHATVVQHVSQLKTAISTHSSTAVAHISAVHAKLDGFAAQGVKLFESKLPELTGLIPPTFWDFTMIFCYMSFVLYISVRAAFFSLRLFKNVFCFFCCFGCCRGGKKETKKVTGKAAEKSKAVEKEKAAAQPPKKGKK